MARKFTYAQNVLDQIGVEQKSASRELSAIDKRLQQQLASFAAARKLISTIVSAGQKIEASKEAKAKTAKAAETGAE